MKELFGWLFDHLSPTPSSFLRISVWVAAALVLFCWVTATYLANFYGINIRSAFSKPIFWVASLMALVALAIAVMTPWLFAGRDPFPRIGVAGFQFSELSSIGNLRLKEQIFNFLTKETSEDSLILQDVPETIGGDAEAFIALRRRKLSGLVWLTSRREGPKLVVTFVFSFQNGNAVKHEKVESVVDLAGSREDRSLEAAARDAADGVFNALGISHFSKGDYDRAAAYLGAAFKHPMETLAILVRAHCRKSRRDLGAAYGAFERAKPNLARTERESLLKELQEISGKERTRLRDIAALGQPDTEARLQALSSYSALGMYSMAIWQARQILDQPGLTAAQGNIASEYLELNQKRAQTWLTFSYAENLTLASSRSPTFFQIGSNYVHDFSLSGEDDLTLTANRIVGSVQRDGAWRIDGEIYDSEGHLLARSQGQTITLDPANLGELVIDGPNRILFDRIIPILVIEETDIHPPMPVPEGGRFDLGFEEPSHIARIVRVSGFYFDRRGRLASEFLPVGFRWYRGVSTLGIFPGQDRKPAIQYGPRAQD